MLKQTNRIVPCIVGLLILIRGSVAGLAVEQFNPNVVVDNSKELAEFVPNETFGVALDGEEKGDILRVYTAINIQKMHAAGLPKISYRLRTELGIEAWHWTEEGTWSDSAHRRGYWTSSDDPKQRVLLSHGYRLPRRGNTNDQAENDGYSRLDDGDSSSFWKSNPYLEEPYTNEDSGSHPQWVVVDFGKPRRINASRIIWGEPFATRFQIQYRSQTNGEGKWQTFPRGLFSNGTGAPDLLLLGDPPTLVRYVRILLIKSSDTSSTGHADPRDSLGFAICEIFLGEAINQLEMRDQVTHSPDNRHQTVIYTSSTDPWHRDSDMDPNTEQPGFDTIFSDAVTERPVLMPIAMLYDTPDNAASEVRFLKRRGYSVRQIEMGEEPDGQYVSPEHEAILYLQFSSAIHNIDSTLQLGGLSFQDPYGILCQLPADCTGIYMEIGRVAQEFGNFDSDERTSWLSRFLRYIRDRGRIEDFTFLSFEWYPFENLCQASEPQLMAQPRLLSDVFGKFAAEVPESIPRIITEYGFSAFAGRSMVEIQSALLTADIFGEFLNLGGNAAYLYGYEPSTPINELHSCAGYGQMMLYEADDRGRARWPMPMFFAARLMTQQWAEPISETHKIYAVWSGVLDNKRRAIVTAYAVKRPDNTWALMLINKDDKRSHLARIAFYDNKLSKWMEFGDRVDVYQYTRQEYKWRSDGENGHPSRTLPPRHFTVTKKAVNLPPFSLTVVRGTLAPP